MISFKEEVIGYIEDELNQGYGLEQIKKDLLSEGYPAQIIEFASNYVAQHSNVSKKDRQKVVPKTEEKHVARRFHLPVLGVGALVFVLLVVFFITGIGNNDEEKALPEKIDVFLYNSLGATPGVHKIAGETQIYSRDEIVEKTRAQAFLDEKRSNPAIQTLRISNAVKGFQKKATVYSVIGGGLQKKTLVEIRFVPDEAVGTLKIVESIPKTLATSGEISLTQGGVMADNDPAIIFTFNDVEIGKTLKAAYVIEKEITTLDTLTFPAEDKKDDAGPAEPAVCGDGRCVEGESYMSCCTDCGCPPEGMCENNACVAAKKDQCQNDAGCNDNDFSTRDSCSGRPKSCQHSTITQCATGDGYCPQECGYDADNDCPQPTPEAAEEAAEQLNITGEQETPDITNITITPENITIGGEVLIEAKVTDANGKEDISRVWVEIMELAQSHGEVRDMHDDGSDGDRAANDAVYTAMLNIGEYYVTGAYHANIFAQDSAGNKKRQQKTFRVIG